MNVSNDSVISKNVDLNESLVQEDLYEQTNNFEHKKCVANKCIFTRWMKPKVVQMFKFVSQDVLMIHAGKTLIFHNVSTQKENILVIGQDKSSPTGDVDSFSLDGIGCVDCNGNDLLTLAEQSPLAKVIVCRYPNMKSLATLIDDSVAAAYKSVRLLGSEYLIGLRDYPAFDLVVWAWMVGERLLTVHTGFIQPEQSLSVLPAGGPNVFHVSHTERDVRCRLQLWTVSLSCRTAYADRTRADMPRGVDFTPADGCCWTHSGWFLFHDRKTAVVFGVRPDKDWGQPAVCATDAGPADQPGVLLRRGTPSGFVLHSGNRLKCYTETEDKFTISWKMIINHTLCKMVVGENNIYGWSNKGALIDLAQKKERVLKFYGGNIKFFTFISPMDKMIATINNENDLQLWEVSTGEFKSELKLVGVVTSLCCNPCYNYVAVSFKHGVVQLITIDPESNDLNQIAKLVLCDEDISSVMFFFDGNQCIVTCFSTGQFYRVKVDVGRSCSVAGEYLLGKRVIDVELTDNKKSSFLTVLYGNQETSDTIGNNIVVFNENFKIVFQLKNTHYYTSTFKWISFVSPNVINLAFITVLSRQVHLMTVNIVQEKVLEFEVIQLDHNLRNVKVFARENYCVSFGDDGVYNLYEFDDDRRWNQIVSVNCSHWQIGGLIAVQVDFDARNVLTLTYHGNVMCTSFNDTCKYVRRSYDVKNLIVTPNEDTKGIGFENESGNRMTWTMIKQENELKASLASHRREKNQIIQDFDAIKKQLLILFETNINGPENMKISLEAFDLNDDYKQWYREQSALERRKYEEKVLGDIKTFKKETEDILKQHWNTLIVKPKSIHCLNKLYKVNNYKISAVDQEVIEIANEIKKKRSLLMNEYVYNDGSSSNIDDYFETNNEMLTEKDHSLTGSISYRFIDNIDVLNPQSNYHRLEMAKDEIILLRSMINMLKHSFNELFEQVCDEKDFLLDNLQEYNDRLVVIDNEFRLACKIETDELSLVDYGWNQHEKTEQLTYVLDHEVSVKPYHVVSKESVTTDEDSRQNEYNKKLLAIDNFRRQALIDMMDGVLEKRWEDELKKDVPKPQCMIKKNSEDYTEDDLKTIDEYEKATTALNDERMKYKNILEKEKTKINQKIKEAVDELDNSIFKLFKIKIKYDSAVYQESLKINRLSKMLSDDDRRNEQIELYENDLLEIKKTLEETIEKIAATEKIRNELLDTKKSLMENKTVFKKDFISKFNKNNYKRALKATNVIPKLEHDTYTPLLGYQFIDQIMSPESDEKLEFLSSNFVNYLHSLKKYEVDKKLEFDVDIWNYICHQRRLKIKSMFTLRTCQKDVADKNILLEHLKHYKKVKETMIDRLETNIEELNSQGFYSQELKSFQLVINQGNIEIELTGHFKDFENTSLVLKKNIEEKNSKIQEMVKMKMDILTDYRNLIRRSRPIKIEHNILKNHKLALYKHRLNYIKSLKKTEDITRYLKLRHRAVNFTKIAEQKVEKRREEIKIVYTKKKEDLNQNLKDLRSSIDKINIDNGKIDKKINLVSLELNELKKNIDHSVTDKMKLASDDRMKNIVKRARLYTNVQELYKEIVKLEAELKSQRLRMYPDFVTNEKVTI